MRTANHTAEVIEGLVVAEKMHNGHLDALEVELNRVLRNIGHSIDTVVAGSELNKGAAKEVLDVLQPLLSSRNSESLKLIDRLREIPESGILVRQIEDYDFRAAVKSLDALRAVLEL